MRTAGRAQLALLLEVAGTPKPGNVDRFHDYPNLRFEHFLAGAIGAGDGLAAAADGEAVGASFELAVRGMAEQRGGNTQFGALLLLVPLVKAAAAEELTPEGATSVVGSTTVEDAVDFYRAFEHVNVAVDGPPAGVEALDVRRGSEAADAIREQELSLADVMALSTDVDGVAREWVGGFGRSFWAGGRLLELDGPVLDRASRTYLELLAEEPDTFVAKVHDEATACEVTDRARATLDGSGDPDQLADDLVAAGVNPGTTADIVAAGLFIALEQGLVV